MHYGQFIMVDAKVRPCLTQSTTSLQSPCPSEKCALLRCWPSRIVPRRHEGASFQTSGSALWAVQHGRSQDTTMVEAISNSSHVSSSLGKVCVVKVPVWPHSAELGSCVHPSDVPELLHEAAEVPLDCDERIRRHHVFPFASLLLALLGVVCLVPSSLSNGRACEWHLGCLCYLAPRSWSSNFQHTALVMFALCHFGPTFNYGSCVTYLLSGIHMPLITSSVQTPREVVGGFESDASDVLFVHSNGLHSHTCLVFPWMQCMRRTWADQFVPLSPFDLSVPLNDTLPWCRSCLTIRGGNTGTWNKVVDGCYLVDPASSHMLVSKIKPCMCNLFDGIYNLDKRSTQALLVALMIYDNSSDRTAFEPVTHHSNFSPINFRW
ncbi:hypothetical protein Lal_00012442 [Lupinus albus]|nr:hypothetical protein Lal_00012442 [Lupinus albus]